SQLMRQVMHEEPGRPRALNPSVPRDLETVVLKAIDRDPDRRYQSAAELAEDLRRFDEDRPILARRVTRRERLWRSCRRNKALAPARAGAAGALVAVAAVSAAFAVFQGRSNDELTDVNRALGQVNRDLKDNQESLETEHAQTLEEKKRKEEALKESQENLA